ncbi:L-threonine kinase [bioreactor metagenome]|uniref:L-threonine kinase n=1 Tax=bioreactor metagenome TaxID=1076179 RepID=A0A644T0V9_9ZZZZ|nr:GHMP kinase [Negativicutes bacterium]
MITVKAPGSCGELVQGTINGENFLVTCPVNLYSKVSVIKTAQQSKESCGIKVQQAIEKTLHYLNISDLYYDLSVKTELPIGKGMASSSADISAACQAVAHSIGKFLTPAEIADIALTIEPTDAIFYPGIVMFDHISGHIRRSLGAPPDMYIAVFDVGGEVDTLDFNRRDDLETLNKAKESQISLALNMIIKGLKTGNASLIGKGATISALANQTILPKPNLEGMIELSQQFGSVGVNIAHSGTVVGLLFDTYDNSQIFSCRSAICKTYSNATYLYTVKLISGGLHKQEGDTHNWIECF